RRRRTMLVSDWSSDVCSSDLAPLIIRGWKDITAENQKSLSRSMTELGSRIKAAKPDVLIEIAPDHWVNFFINNLPSICVGMGERSEDRRVGNDSRTREVTDRR